MDRLKSSFRKLYDRYGNLVKTCTCICESHIIFFSFQLPGKKFDVDLCPTKASAEQNLYDVTYILKLDSQSISLLDRNGNTSLLTWPYPFIRRFHFQREDLFMFECGRRCQTGPGVFQFSVKENFYELGQIVRLSTTIPKCKSHQQGRDQLDSNDTDDARLHAGHERRGKAKQSTLQFSLQEGTSLSITHISLCIRQSSSCICQKFSCNDLNFCLYLICR